MAKKINESEILFAQEELKIDGKNIVVHPYSWAGAIQVAKPLSIIMKTVVENVNALDEVLKVLQKENTKENGEETAEAEKVSLSQKLMLIAGFIDGVKNPEELIQAISELVSASTAMSVEAIKALMMDDMYNLSKAVYDVNKSFFDKRLAPMMKKKPSVKQRK
jgi:hypothetical protein